MFKKFLSMMLTAAMLIGAVPSFAVSAPQTVSASGDSALLSLDAVAPDAYATATNPYGYDKGVAFTLTVGNELLYLGGANGKTQTSVLDADSTDSLKSYIESPNTASGSYKFPEGTWNWVKAVAFDNNADDAKDNKVLFVGLKGGDRHAYAWVLDYETNEITTPLDLGNMDWIDEDYAQYMSTSLFELAAGDFDGDGVDTLLVYAPLNLIDKNTKGCTLYELSYTNSLKSAEDTANELLMAVYIRDQTAMTYTDTDNSVKTARDKLAVSMQVADFNGDNIDDLAVLSYSHNRYNGASVEYYKPQLKVGYGDKMISGAPTPSEDGIFTVAVTDGGKVTFPVAASLAAGDFNGDGYEDLYVVGQKSSVSADKASQGITVTSDTWYAQPFYGGKGGRMTDGGYTELKNNSWFRDGFYPDDNCYGKVMAAGVAISGNAAPDMLFISGSLYKVSTGKPVEKLTSHYFGNSDDGAGANILSNTFMQSVAVGNFDNNGAGREQVVFTIGLKQKGQDDYHFKAGFLGGEDFADTAYADGSTCYGEATGYYCTDIDGEADYIHEDKGDDPNEGLNCLLIPLDFGNDSVIAKYRSAGYVYTDPDVKAVLQAAPYFGDITTSGKNSTGYSIETSYSDADTESDSVNGSIGFAAGGGFPGVFSTNVSLSATGGWTKSFTETYTTSYKDSFAAGSEDVVVVHRIPLIAYSFDVQNENGEWSGEAQLEFTVPQEPVYETMTVDSYNAFAATYNAMMKNAGATDFARLETIDAAANWLSGNEGNPYAYNQNGWGNSTIGAQQISKGSFALGKSNATNSVAWTEGNSETDNFTATCGFALNYSVLFGPKGVGGAGITMGLNYSHGWGMAVTTGSANGMTCAVQDLDGTGLLAKGMPQDVLDMYGFTWTFGQWERHLSGDAENKTPFLGYSLTNVSSPAPSVKDLQATAVDNASICLEWTKPIGYKGGPPVTGYYVYRVDNGSYTKISEQLGAQATSYTVTGLDAQRAYTFVVTTTGSFSGTTLEGAWSNEASAATRVQSFTVTYYADDPKAATIQAYSTGHTPFASGAEITSHAVVTLTATAANEQSRILGIELDHGNGTDVQFIEADETQTSAQCALVVTGDTTIRVLTKREVDGSEIVYTDVYTDGEELCGTVSAEVEGVPFPAPGGLVTAPVTFTATPAQGYVLTGWRITADGVTETVSAVNMNPFVLKLEKEAYTIEACFELIAQTKATITVEQPDEGGYIRLTDANGAELPLNDAGCTEVPFGTAVTFTAIGSTGYVFQGWSGDATEQTGTTVTVTANADLTVGASFKAPIKYKLTYTVASGKETGAVAVNPAVASGGYVAAGTELTVSVAAAEGYRIDTVTIQNGTQTTVHDLSDGLRTEAQRTFALTASAGVTVNFVPIETYQVDLRLSNLNCVDIMINNISVPVTDSHFVYTCRYKDDVTVTLTPPIGYYLDGESTLDWLYIGEGRYQVTYKDIMQDISGTVSMSNGSGCALPWDGSGYAITDIVRTPSGFYPENEVAYHGSVSFNVVPTDTRGIAAVALFDPYNSIRDEVITDHGDGTFTVYIPKVTESIELDVTMNPGYTFAIEDCEGGTVSATLGGRPLDKYNWAVTGDVVDITAIPDEGYRLVSLTAGGEPVTDDTYTVQNKPFKIQAVFEKIVYDIPASTETYTVSDVQITRQPATEEKELTPGCDLIFTVTPQEGLDIASLALNAGAVQQNEDGSAVVTVYDVQAPVELTVETAPHTHEWTYTVDETTDTITGECAKTCGCPIDSASVTLEQPSETVFDGTQKTVTIRGEYELLQPQVDYCCEDGCRAMGEHTVTMTLGDQQVMTSFTIERPLLTLENVTAAFYYVNRVHKLTPEQLAKADINCDGVVNLWDAVTLFYMLNDRM